MLTLKIAFKNIFRQKRRSILTGLSMVGGFVLFSFGIGLFEGTYEDIVNLFIYDHTGHIQVHKSGYREKPSIYNTIENPADLEKKILDNPEVKGLSPRLFNTALAFSGNRTTLVNVIGIDPIKEGRSFNLPKSIDIGSFLSEKPGFEAVLGYGAAELLHVKKGDEISLLGQAADGSIANENFKITGVLGKSNGAYNRINCYINLKEAQTLFALDNMIHEIAVIINDFNRSEEVAKNYNSLFQDNSIEAAPWHEVEKFFYMAMQVDRKGIIITESIMILLISIGILNTVLMSILERTREYGVLKAVGTRPAMIFRMIVYETLLLCLMALCIGSILSLSLNYIFSINGIPYGPIEWGGVTFNKMQSIVNFKTIWLPGIVTLLSSGLVSIIPAMRAARVSPVTALRHN